MRFKLSRYMWGVNGEWYMKGINEIQAVRGYWGDG